jgi:hypothetical protein
MQIANALKVPPAFFFDGSPGAGRKTNRQLASAADELSEFAAMVEKIADHQ